MLTNLKKEIYIIILYHITLFLQSGHLSFFLSHSYIHSL